MFCRLSRSFLEYCSTAARQLVRLVTLVGILLLKVLLAVVTQLSKVALILRARAAAQAQ
jgi:hypothetical protein